MHAGLEELIAWRSDRVGLVFILILLFRMPLLLLTVTGRGRETVVGAVILAVLLLLLAPIQVILTTFFFFSKQSEFKKFHKFFTMVLVLENFVGSNRKKAKGPRANTFSRIFVRTRIIFRYKIFSLLFSVSGFEGCRFELA